MCHVAAGQAATEPEFGSLGGKPLLCREGSRLHDHVTLPEKKPSFLLIDGTSECWHTVPPTMVQLERNMIHTMNQEWNAPNTRTCLQVV